MNSKQLKNFMLGCAIAGFASCSAPSTNQQVSLKSGLNPNDFADTVNGKATELVVLKNNQGTEVCITNFGGRIVAINVDDKDGVSRDVVLGFDNVKKYADKVNSPSDFGASIGRYANRINQGIIVPQAGDTIQLPKNNFGHCLHGGPDGWQYQVYDVESKTDSTLTLVYNSKDGEMNFPGNVVAKVNFTLTSFNEIVIDYTATTDKRTVVNMTNHSYFNLNGDPNQTVENHVLYLNADNYTPVDSTYMPTGEIASVKDTPFDFNTEHNVGQDVTNFENTQVKYGNGFDHNWCLNTYNNDTKTGDLTKVCASLYSPATGIKLKVYTNEPGIQCYSGNFLDGSATGKNGKVYNQHAGLCLETQKYPNSPNQENFQSSWLNPGEEYHSVCIFAFSKE